MLRRAALVVAVATLTLAWVTSSARTELSPFCRKELYGFTCRFFNTTQDVVAGTRSVAAGLASLHPAILCKATLDVSNDSSTVGKTAAPGQPRTIHPSLNRTMANVTGARTFSSRSGSAGLGNTPGTRYEPLQDCAVNVSVQHSTVHRVEGHFVVGQIYYSKIRNMNGTYIYLDMKSTMVSNMSLSGRMIKIEDTKIVFVSQLKAERLLQLHRTHLGTVAPRGLLFFPPGREEPALLHTLRDVVIQRLEAGSLVVVSSMVNVTNMTVRWMARDAVTVQTSGQLTLTDVLLHCDPLYYCLNLEMGARLVLINVTIRNKTIIKLNLVATSKSNMYPLFALVSKDDRAPLVMTFPWYWLMIMTACGIVAGIVIGSAFVWKRPSLPSGAMFAFTLSDLLSHDRLQESNGEASRDDHIPDLSLRPAFTRQASGTSSSSFAPYNYSPSRPVERT